MEHTAPIPGCRDLDFDIEPHLYRSSALPLCLRWCNGAYCTFGVGISTSMSSRSYPAACIEALGSSAFV
eukprot:3232833-Amphidinium_carterae.1